MIQVFGNRVEHRSLQKLGPSSKIQLRSQQTNFLRNEKISKKDLNQRPYLPMPGVLFTILHWISQKYLRLVSYTKDWDQKCVILGLFFSLSPGLVFIRFDVGPGD